MTTHARTPNEQRIAALEVEVVTMREALEAAVKDGSGRSGGSVFMIHREQWLALSAALSSSTDYSGKVVVGRDEGEATATICAVVQPDHGSDCDCQVCVAFARLDSLRKADAATNAVHPAEGTPTDVALRDIVSTARAAATKEGKP